MSANEIEGATILITGGAGFVGSHLVEDILPLGPAKVLIIDNLVRGSLENMSTFIDDPCVEFTEGDIRDPILMGGLLSRADYCFHMAALRINACAAEPAEGFDAMVRATFDLLELARARKIRKLIYSSSASVYGLARHFPTPETDSPYDNRTFYGAAKLFGEQLLRSYYHMFGLDYVALRYFNIYGPRMDTEGRYTEVMIKWLDCIRDGRRPAINGDGSTSMDFVYVRDVARANVLALLSDATNEVFNIGCRRETTLRELLEILLRANGSDLDPIFMPESTVNPVSRRLAEITKAEEKLGFRPDVSLEEGVQRLSEWYFSRSGGVKE